MIDAAATGLATGNVDPLPFAERPVDRVGILPVPQRERARLPTSTCGRFERRPRGPFVRRSPRGPSASPHSEVRPGSVASPDPRGPRGPYRSNGLWRRSYPPVALEGVRGRVRTARGPDSGTEPCPQTGHLRVRFPVPKNGPRYLFSVMSLVSVSMAMISNALRTASTGAGASE